jgi:hypothetical protein
MTNVPDAAAVMDAQVSPMTAPDRQGPYETREQRWLPSRPRWAELWAAIPSSSTGITTNDRPRLSRPFALESRRSVTVSH